MTLDHLLLIILVGLVAGFLASHLVTGHGFGLGGDIVVGILGALIGTLLLGTVIVTYILTPFGIPSVSVLGQVIVAFIGAALLIAVIRLVSGSRYASGYRPRRRVL
jgi:uncharacterized membrane protein YeaQ/YmgE (transglycosylase-associated protein family)